MSNLADLLSRVEDIPDSSPAQHAAARAYLTTHAPDLLDAIFGDQS